ncbi:adenylate kinase [Arthrobacter globiformis]|nr:adenylate kinase [Arthrobacter globiformis]
MSFMDQCRNLFPQSMRAPNCTDILIVEALSLSNPDRTSCRVPIRVDGAGGPEPAPLIIGPPGSGKGTQAERISERLGVVAASTGDIFRANVKAGTPLGVEPRKYKDAGGFVPDSVTNKMVRDRLGEADVEHGFLLDGYPRTAEQVDYLDMVLGTVDQKLDVVLQLTATDEEVVARLLDRAGETGRSDDNEAVIRHRLDLYHAQT